MFLKSLRVVNFRNIRSTKVEFDKGVNFFLGMNAQGKTNFLEAAALLADGRSFRNSRLSEMILHGENEACTEGIVINQETENVQQIKFSKAGRSYFIDGKPITDLNDYLGRIHYIVFTADFLSVVSGSPQDRRDFMDRGIFQIRPHYVHLLRVYKKNLKERNSHLMSANPNRSLLSVYAEQLAGLGARIIKFRMEYVTQIYPYVQSKIAAISNEEDRASLKYETQWVDPEENVHQINDRLRSLMDENIDSDLKTGNTSAGPHRDDLCIKINGYDIRQYGSRGQKRSCLLAMKLAEMELFHAKRSDYPILIMDDIAAELDADRLKRLFSLTPESAQIFISATHFSDMGFDRKTKIYNISNGTIVT